MDGSRPGSEVEVVERSIDAFNARDLSALLETLDHDVELLPFSAKLTGECYRGAKGVRRWLADVADEWSEWRVEVDEVRVAGNRVLTVGRVIAKGRETGVDVEVPAGFVSVVRDGRVVRMESFGDPADALEAVAATA